MAGTFDVLRANDLIFNYVVSNWLMGQDPPAFDILAWNADSTRMPAAMHAFYLRSLYVREPAGQGRAGARRAAAVAWPTSRTTPTWSARSTTTSCPGGRPTRATRPARRARSGSCWAAAATSPASSTRPARRPGTRWASRTRGPGRSGGKPRRRHSGSWWEDWARWADARAGRLGPPPPMGSQTSGCWSPGTGRRAPPGSSQQL